MTIRSWENRWCSVSNWKVTVRVGGNRARKPCTILPGAGCRVLVCDIRLPDLDGEQLFRRALPDLGATPVIFITAFGEVEQAVRLMQARERTIT